MTSGRLCQSFVSANSPSAPVTVLDSPSVDDNDLNDSLIPTWDDADDIIRQIFDVADSSQGDEDGDGDDWESDSSDDDDEDDEDANMAAAEQSLIPPWLRKHGPMLPFARNKLPVISSDESDEDDDNDEDIDSSSDGEESNAENNRKQSFPRGKHRRGKSHDSSQFRFSLPKHLLHKSTNPAVEAKSLKPVQVELSKAVRIPIHGELVIRADVLQRNHFDDALDLIRRFGYPTRRLVVEEVHQGTAVEALLIYLLEVTKDNGAHPMRLRYTGTWMSPTVSCRCVWTSVALREPSNNIASGRPHRSTVPAFSCIPSWCSKCWSPNA